jgi:uncharacterized damage-inducible protein DinB
MQTFYADYLNNLQELHNDIEKALNSLLPEALDWSPKAGINSITALVVHLTGSQRFLFAEVIKGQDIHRDRDAEFLAKGLTPDKLTQRLKDSMTFIAGVVESLTLDDLATTRIMRGREVTVGWVLGHALKHTATHLGHVQMMHDMWQHLNG